MEQTVVFLVLGLALILFVWDRFRYDVVALLALLTLVVVGIIPHETAFSGFAHPAVVTVAAILIVSQGLAESGLVDRISTLLSTAGTGKVAQVTALVAVVCVCSAFMNNVGALALLMPVAVRMAKRSDMSPSTLLMPLAFGSLLGGMTTLIGTPPNIIIGSFRSTTGSDAFGMFDFAPVGVIIAILGVAFISLVGWRLIPNRKGSDGGSVFQTEDYTTELVVEAGSRAANKPLGELRQTSGADFVVVAVLRGERKILSPDRSTKLIAGDHLIVEVAPEAIGPLVEQTGLQLAGPRKLDQELLASDDVDIVEAVVLPRSQLSGRTVVETHLRSVYHLNLLGVAREGQRIGKRLSRIRFRTSDVLLVQGERAALHDSLQQLGCLPLAPRELGLPKRRRLIAALAIFVAALVLLVARVLPAQTAFAAAALAMVLTGLVSLRSAYRAIDWPVIVLLGAMIPVGGALESSGGAALIAEWLAGFAEQLPLSITLGLILVLAMFLSDVMNNAATAVIMAPISIQVANGLSASADPFLMAVAVGASCAFLTPIGHQSNTLVMGPGGYRFGDYWRMGLPLELGIIVLGVPAILWFWPAYP